MKNTKSGKVEFYRFIFCLGILFFHMGKNLRKEPSLDGPLRFELFPHGSIGVEVFFIVSGFFMARAIYKKVLADEKNQMVCNQAKSNEYLGFIKNKYLRVIPEHVPAFIITFIAYVIVHHMGISDTIVLAIKNIPSFFLIQMSGVYLQNILGIEWYISSMLIAMAIIYPICRKYYYTFTRYFAPIVCLLILGYLQQQTKSLTGVMVWMGFAYKSTIRAFVEIALGTTCFEVSRYLSGKYEEAGKKIRVRFTVIEVLCFISTMLFVLMTFQKKYEVIALGMIFVMITIATSGVSYGEKLFNNKVIYFLGDISLSIYLSQLAAITIVAGTMKDYSFWIQVIATTILTIVVTAIVKLLSIVIKRQLTNCRLAK